MTAELEGFGDGYQSEVELDTRALVQEKNRKNKKSGGFQSMGLSYNVYRGIMKTGYKVPTPIQRKVQFLHSFLLRNSCVSYHINHVLSLGDSADPGKERCCSHGSNRKWQNCLLSYTSF